jgi:hypothetical protein
MSEKFAAIRALQTLRGYIGHEQLQAIGEACQGDERYAMCDKLVEYESRIQEMPKTFEQDGKGDDAIAYLHYFKGGMDWYITEKDMEPEQLQAFGLADLSMGFPEIGYISITELIEHNVELDLHFIPQTIGKIKDFLRAAGRLAIAASVAVSLSACASPVWEKPNATQAEWQQTKAECMIEAAQRAPAKDVLVPIAGSSFTSENCDKHGRNCIEYSSTTPPTVEQVDTNVPLRDQETKPCLTRKGWMEVKP